mmetsp:Transcript_16769/g.33575  ORF Transcript_16769/g.33575 Transcript_16769/m.33575 type:complete len:85 (-) Transcript_16769:132-386(-)
MSQTLSLVRQTARIAAWSFAAGFLLERNINKLPLVHQWVTPQLEEGDVEIQTSVRLLVGVDPTNTRTALKWTSSASRYGASEGE